MSNQIREYLIYYNTRSHINYDNGMNELKHLDFNEIELFSINIQTVLDNNFTPSSSGVADSTLVEPLTDYSNIFLRLSTKTGYYNNVAAEYAVTGFYSGNSLFNKSLGAVAITGMFSGLNAGAKLLQIGLTHNSGYNYFLGNYPIPSYLNSII